MRGLRFGVAGIAVTLVLASCAQVERGAEDFRSYGAGALPAVEVRLDAVETVQEIAPGVRSEVWTFGGTAPGPVVRVREGETVRFTISNRSTDLSHSIDFHAAQTPWNVNYKPVRPGKTLSFDWVARFPGVFMYHCGVPPVLHHIANGMYGAIIVEPRVALARAREYVLVASEYYTKPGSDGILRPDAQAMLEPRPTYVVFNGRANQYLDHPLQARPDERIRLWVMDAGPSLRTAFHVIGALFDHVYPDGNPTNALNGLQTWDVPPGGGAMFELSIPDEGLYPFVTHAFAYTGLGSVGVLAISRDAPPAPEGYPRIGEPFSAGVDETTGVWSGAPPKPAFPLKAPEAPAGPAEISMFDLLFSPRELTVSAGAKIIVRNRDPLLHDVTIDAPAVQVVLDGGEDGSFTVPEPGTYDFYCSVPGHRDAGMTGTLTVTEPPA